MNKEPVGY